MAEPASVKSQLYTELISGERVIISPANGGSYVSRLAIAFVSGTPKIKGNINKLITLDVNGNQVVRSSTVLTLTSQNAFVALESDGTSQLNVDIDCTLGSVLLMAYL